MDSHKRSVIFVLIYYSVLVLVFHSLFIGSWCTLVYSAIHTCC